ncbi:MAG TPA: FAD-dependent oxidoreductase, partial [Acidimicrobiales bacterium]|nr:FAD-dependent oxidoreductase [Acidimicrobiales bacterium]
MTDRPAAAHRAEPRARPTPRRPPHAVVVGAGPDGVEAALVLARLVERVTLVDAADVPGPEWQDGPGGRRRPD